MDSEFLIVIRVRPNSSNNKVGDLQENHLDSLFNFRHQELMVKQTKLSVRDFSIVHGELARDKRVLIKGNLEEIESKFENLKSDLRLF